MGEIVDMREYNHKLEKVIVNNVSKRKLIINENSTISMNKI